MGDVRRRTRPGVDPRDGKVPEPPARRSLLYPALIVGGTILAVVVAASLGWLPPWAPRALLLGLQWLIGLGNLAAAVMFWKLPERVWGVRLRLLFLAVAAWFLVRAAFETRAALE
jgi:hypothetical protein